MTEETKNVVNPTGNDVSRRGLLRASAWSIPVLAVVTAAPLASASTSQCQLTAVLVASDQPVNQVVLQTSVPGVTVTLTSTRALGTVTEQNGQNFNFTANGSGWNGDADGFDFVFTDFAVPGAIVLNQRGSASSVSPRQDVQFVVKNNGVPIGVSSMKITVFDISSVEETFGAYAWTATYRDAVGFSQQPESIAHVSAPPLADPGVGSGTYTNPFRRVSVNAQTEDEPYIEEFSFDSVASTGLGLRYTSYGSKAGWQFIALNAISFNVCL
ncbi:hypothetical protein C5B85_09115 [Pseudoclavibacter sp. AY1F1]|uniref:hypothetical protein n=1 Tax=Pseudoclavibacter sp. AY1F1 TaxID=2080583 RepID=UPI000CE85E46|nr:hypothetical protein [Pseudoclavibacter sp. AY1F1]PPF44883.1 hypothetical protein C5B85_09115 [Pseudoclavibacter sp. AY1F1]